jgi:hypothetical protein
LRFKMQPISGNDPANPAPDLADFHSGLGI